MHQVQTLIACGLCLHQSRKYKTTVPVYSIDEKLAILAVQTSSLSERQWLPRYDTVGRDVLHFNTLVIAL